MVKTSELLREGKGKLDRLTAGLRTPTPGSSAAERRLRAQRAEARYAEARQHFEELRAAGTVGIADLKVKLEKAWDAFQAELAAKPGA